MGTRKLLATGGAREGCGVGEFVRERLAIEVVCVDLDERAPLWRNGTLFVDGVDRTGRLACATVDAFGGVDVVLLIFLSRMDTIDGADIHTRRIFDADAGLANDVCHGILLVECEIGAQALLCMISATR
jgi:hypothetical protein